MTGDLNIEDLEIERALREVDGMAKPSSEHVSNLRAVLLARTRPTVDQTPKIAGRLPRRRRWLAYAAAVTIAASLLAMILSGVLAPPSALAAVLAKAARTRLDTRDHRSGARRGKGQIGVLVFAGTSNCRHPTSDVDPSVRFRVRHRDAIQAGRESHLQDASRRDRRSSLVRFQLHRSADQRGEPRRLVPGARSVETGQVQAHDRQERVDPILVSRRKPDRRESESEN